MSHESKAPSMEVGVVTSYIGNMENESLYYFIPNVRVNFKWFHVAIKIYLQLLQ